MTPITFTSSCLRHSAGATSSKRPMRRMPAQLKRTSSAARVPTKSASAVRPRLLVRDVDAAVAPPIPAADLAPRPCARRRRRRRSSRPRQPRWPKRSAVALPMPDAAPVTKMVLLIAGCSTLIRARRDRWRSGASVRAWLDVTGCRSRRSTSKRATTRRRSPLRPKSIDGWRAGPEPLFDRATAYELAERYARGGAPTSRRRSRRTARSRRSIRSRIDDAYFSALLAAARKEAERDVAQGRRASPALHAVCTQRRARRASARTGRSACKGELPSLLDKTKDIGAS